MTIIGLIELGIILSIAFVVGSFVLQLLFTVLVLLAGVVIGMIDSVINFLK